LSSRGRHSWINLENRQGESFHFSISILLVPVHPPPSPSRSFLQRPQPTVIEGGKLTSIAASVIPEFSFFCSVVCPSCFFCSPTSASAKGRDQQDERLVIIQPEFRLTRSVEVSRFRGRGKPSNLLIGSFFSLSGVVWVPDLSCSGFPDMVGFVSFR
jgi:hypothetical protein